VALVEPARCEFLYRGPRRSAEQGRPEIFNTDQGSQFTSDNFIDVLRVRGVAISMDGRGRLSDNIFVERLLRSFKYEEVYLKAYQNVAEARHSIAAYFELYNHEDYTRPWVTAPRARSSRKRCGLPSFGAGENRC
jgi:transposase InsO family protein